MRALGVALLLGLLSLTACSVSKPPVPVTVSKPAIPVTVSVTGRPGRITSLTIPSSKLPAGSSQVATLTFTYTGDTPTVISLGGSRGIVIKTADDPASSGRLVYDSNPAHVTGPGIAPLKPHARGSRGYTFTVPPAGSYTIQGVDDAQGVITPPIHFTSVPRAGY